MIMLAYKVKYLIFKGIVKISNSEKLRTFNFYDKCKREDLSLGTVCMLLTICTNNPSGTILIHR